MSILPPFREYTTLAYQLSILIIKRIKCGKKAEKAYYNGDFETIHRQYADYDVNPPKQSVLIAIEKAMEYSLRWRFVYDTTNKWSHLFYSCVCCEMLFIPFHISCLLPICFFHCQSFISMDVCDCINV